MPHRMRARSRRALARTIDGWGCSLPTTFATCVTNYGVPVSSRGIDGGFVRDASHACARTAILRTIGSRPRERRSAEWNAARIRTKSCRKYHRNVSRRKNLSSVES